MNARHRGNRGRINRLARDGIVEPISQDQLLRRERGQGNIHFPCSAGHEQDWQPHLVDLHSAICDDHTCCCCCCFSHSAHWLPTRKKLLYTVANPARGLLNREKKKKKSGSAPPPPRALLVRRKKMTIHVYSHYTVSQDFMYIYTCMQMVILASFIL